MPSFLQSHLGAPPCFCDSWRTCQLAEPRSAVILSEQSVHLPRSDFHQIRKQYNTTPWYLTFELDKWIHFSLSSFSEPARHYNEILLLPPNCLEPFKRSLDSDDACKNDEVHPDCVRVRLSSHLYFQLSEAPPQQVDLRRAAVEQNQPPAGGVRHGRPQLPVRQLRLQEVLFCWHQSCSDWKTSVHVRWP